MRRLLSFLSVAACFLSFLVFASSALAEGFALYEYSSRGIALGGAVVARKPDPSAVAFNPALMTRLPGMHAAAGVTVAHPRGKMEWDNPNWETTSLKDSYWPIPHAYFTWQIDDRWTFGIGEFTRFGLGFEYPDTWPGRFNVYEVALSTFSVNPAIAWRATDSLSLAAGVEIIYVNLDLKKRVNLGITEVDSSITGADDVGFGFNLGAHYQFNEQWAAGLHYRSSIRVRAFGDAEFTNKGNPAYDQAVANYFTDGEAHSTVILPDSIAFGVSWTPVPEFSVEVGGIWTRWSTFRHLNIHLPGNMPTSETNKHWRDSWRFNVGLEYDVVDWLTLRAGYAYDQSPMVEPYDDYLVPTGNRNIYSGGLGFNLDAWKIDFAYSIVVPHSRSYRDNPQLGTWASKTKDSYTQTLSCTVSYEF